MSAAASKEAKQKSGSVESVIERAYTYTPVGEKEPITLTVAMVQKFLMPPTRSGLTASFNDALKFVMLCRARELNPWTGDAYAVGYDENGPGGSKVANYNLITSVQALYKRAELCSEYDGIESGIIVRAISRGDEPRGELEYREGDFFDSKEEELLGGWARVHRTDKKKPDYEAVRLSTFKRATPIWGNNPEGMVSKVAEAGALRKAFPNQLGGLYISEEMHEGERVDPKQRPKVINDLDDITAELKSGRKAIEEKPEAEPIDVQFKRSEAEVEPAVQSRSESQSVANVAEGVAEFDEMKDQIAGISSAIDAELLKDGIVRSAGLTGDEKDFLLKRIEDRSQDWE